MSRDTPTPEMILAYAAGDLAAADRATVEAYLEDHPDEANRVALYRAAKAYRQHDESVAPPRRVLDRAKAIFTATEQPAAPSWLERVDAFIARLVFDSRLQPMGVRYAGSPLRVQLSYETEEMTIDLQAHRGRQGQGGGQEGSDADQAERRWRVLGQLAGETSVAGRPLRLVQASTGRTVAESAIDDGEMFEFEVEPGRYDLCVELATGTLVVPGIELR